MDRFNNVKSRIVIAIVLGLIATLYIHGGQLSEDAPVSVHALEARMGDLADAVISRYKTCDWSTANIIDDNDPAGPSWCQNLAQKGQTLLCMMDAELPTNNGQDWPTQSIWQDPSVFAAYGWSIHASPQDRDITDDNGYLGPGFEGALYDPQDRTKRLIDPKGSKWVYLEQYNNLNVPFDASGNAVKRSPPDASDDADMSDVSDSPSDESDSSSDADMSDASDTSDDAMKYVRTAAGYLNLVNLQNFDENGKDNGGVLIRYVNYGPVWAATTHRAMRNRAPIPLDRVTPLRQFSDVLGLGLQWLRNMDRANGVTWNYQNIEHVFAHDVRNAQTIEVLQSICEKDILDKDDMVSADSEPTIQGQC